MKLAKTGLSSAIAGSMLTITFASALVNDMSYGLLDVIGNIGVAILIFTYLLLQLNRLAGNGLTYSLLNMLGASLIMISLVANFNLSAFIIEAFWVLISLLGVFRYVLSHSVQSL
jgi:hypothetical protein